MPDDRLADDPPWQSVGELVRDAAQRFGDREALRSEGRGMSFAELDAATASVAAAFAAHGITAGDRVAMMVSNGLDFPVCWLGLLRLGAVALPVNTRLKSADLTHLLRDGDVSLTVASRGLTEAVQTVAEVPVLEAESFVAAAGTEAPIELPAISRDAVANLQYTSGTTGMPKACMLTHDYWVRLGWLLAGCSEISASDVVLTAQPFSYIDPQWNLTMCLVGGATLVILPRFSASGFWASVRENGVTLFYVLGTMPLLLLKQPPSPHDRANQVRLVMCSAIVPGFHETLEARWGAPWREVYGMTETGVDLAVRSWETDSVGSGTVGRPVPTKEARILDARGEAVPTGMTGELCVRGWPLMSGYWRQPEATAATIQDGWLHTGDLARVDDEGRFRVVGRLKDMVRRGGENIACAEVEAVLAQHPSVASVALVPVPDELWGEEPKAVVQLTSGYSEDSATASLILEFARERLARFKVPRYIEFIDDFPRTPSERIDKPTLIADHRVGTVYDAGQDATVSSTGDDDHEPPTEPKEVKG